MKNPRIWVVSATISVTALTLTACGTKTKTTASPSNISIASPSSTSIGSVPSGTSSSGAAAGSTEASSTSPVSAAPSGKPFKVGVSWDNKSIALIQAWEDYQQQIAKEQGLNFQWVYTVADDDPAKQASNIEDMINQGVNVIVARASDSAAIGSSIKAAAAAKIPFVAFDRAPTKEKPTAYVGGDSRDEALTTATKLAELMKAAGVKGKCIELLGALTDVNAVNRTKAFAEVAASSGAYTIVQQVPTEWKPDLFLSGTTNALKAHPEANCLLTASDFAFPSIQSALEGAGKWAKIGDPKHIWIGALDVFPEAYAAMKAGYIDVGTTWDAFSHSKELVKALAAISKGQDPGCPETGCLAKGRLATPSTVDSLENVWSRDYNPDGSKKKK